MTVQAGLCQTWSEPKFLFFSRTGSNFFPYHSVPADFFDDGKSPAVPEGANSAKPKSILAHYSSSSEEEEEEDSRNKKIKEPDKGGGIKSSNSALPPGN